MPTDTLPALIALPDHARQIWTLKQRPSEKPLILMAANAEALLALVRPEAEAAARPLAQLHWPGPSPWCCLLLVMRWRNLGCVHSIPVPQRWGSGCRLVRRPDSFWRVRALWPPPVPILPAMLRH